ncbi:MAG: hypothetical protein IJP12_03405 [Methanobrevibacter sp.]|nr:hypothetical protein [Methanobrevibacter sp.]
MYYVENNSMIINCDLFSLCNCIQSKLEDFKKFIIKLLKNENSELLEEYSVYYNALFDLLGLFDEFKNEHHALLKTNRIIEYVFKNKKLTPELKRYINSVWKSFSTLLKFKIKLLEDENIFNEEYEKAYSNFRNELNSHHDYFYADIYIPSHEFDDEIDQIKKILF